MKTSLFKKITIVAIALYFSVILSYGQELEALRCLNGKYGFKDKNTGSVVIPCKYDETGDWQIYGSKKLATVKLNDKWGCINETGVTVVPIEYLSRTDAEKMAQEKMEDSTSPISVVAPNNDQSIQQAQQNVLAEEITEERKDTTIMSAEKGYALLHIYRKGSMAGAAISYNLRIEELVICRVNNKWKESIKIDKEGKIVLWAHTEAREELPITIEFGKEYYIRCKVKFGVVIGRPSMELVDEETGKTEFASI